MGGHDVEDQQLTSEKVQEKVVLNEPAVTEVVEPSDEVARTSPGVWKGIALTSVCTLAGLIVSVTLSSVLISLPIIGEDLGIQEAQLQWLISAYSLSSGCLLILFGRLADLYGRRKVFIVGCVFQGAFALGGGFANDLLTISVLRGFQGIGAATTIPASLGILAHAFPPGQARSLAFATFSASQPLGGGVGFAIGGLLTQFASTTWRTMFYVTAALAVVCIAGALVFVEPDHPSTELDKRVDWLGAFFVTSGLVLIVFVLSDGEVAPQQWRTPYIIALLVIGVFFLALFILWQWYLERPSARNTMLPMIPAGIICNVIIGLVIGRVPAIFLISLGCFCTGIAGLLFALIDPDTTYWAFGFPASVITVLGADFVFAGGSLFIAKLALPHEQSLAGGLFQTMAQLGTAIGLSITTIVFDRVRRNQSVELGVVIDAVGSNAPPEAQLKAYRAAQWTVLGLGLFSCILAVIFLRGVGIVGGPPPEPPSPEEKSQNSQNTSVESSGQSPSK
ncbi:hypothetical protein NLI96_g1242 [Meripilus lineatus]|uniref:Major facilitator superfamily (MFS) profile domain-containing protein n=1 Tax=Meripilus lineatus TaxID=2056292 RepID=A0AAD5YN00_9APHY|nr:hypothetical protein NLI96_g1242 [Physisporinus lineatus]